MTISPARAAAFDVLLKIERDRAFSSILLPEYEAKLNEKDRSLCHQLVLGVLRTQILLDHLISVLAGGKRLDLEVRIALRIGLYQIRELDRIPEHSAVNESVQLVQRAKKTSAKGLVNAVLRRAARDEVKGLPPLDASITSSHPAWLLERWADQFGADRANSIAEANNRAPRLSFRLTAKGSKETMLPVGAARSDITDGAFTAERSSPELRRMVDDGLIYFQDEASQMVGKLAASGKPSCVLEVCAAPGSKTSLIAAEISGSNGRVVAGDLYQKRVEFLRDSCRRQGVSNVAVVRYDAERSLPFGEGAFETVLVDAPCSGTGTIRANPEIRYFLSPDDLTELQTKQLRILTNASKTVYAGGRLFYSTCSLERDENEDVVGAFLEGNGEFSVVGKAVPERFRTDAGFGRTFPDRDGTDGFFVAVMERR